MAGSRGAVDPMIASVDRQEITTAFSALRIASNNPTNAQAVENWVPFIRPSPSFGPRTTGCSPANSSAFAEFMRWLSNKDSPSPIRVAAIWASGARSPEAPTEPWVGINGVIPLAKRFCNSSIVSQRIPDAPRPTDKSFSTIMSRVVFTSRGSPTPQQ